MAWFNDDVELTVLETDKFTVLRYWHDSHVLLEVSMLNGLAAISVNGGNPSSAKERNAFLDAMTHAKAVIRAYEKSGNWSDAWLVMPPVHGIGIDRNVSSERGFIDETYSINGNRACMVILKNSNGGSYVSTYQFGEHDYEEIALIHMFAKKRIEAHEKALEEKKQAEEKKRAEEDRVRSIVTEEREAFLTELLRRMGYGWEPKSEWVIQADNCSASRYFVTNIGKEGRVLYGKERWFVQLCNDCGDLETVCQNEWSNCNE